MFGRIAKLFKDPQSTDSDINLLLLGGTGVGKSTFINSISNYFKYASFKAAQKGKVDVLIPVRLNISKYNILCGDPDKNESHERGKSATQHVKVYLFPIKVDGRVFNLRIVDSPGVGDPRGIDQDNVHIDNILAYLATLKKLHGICFVMKSNETRFTSFIEYCLKQILTRLDKSASDNIIFITTYSKTAQYTAGETKIHCLEPLVQNIKSKPPHVDIPLNDHNVYSLDNEAFKALLEMQEGKSFHKNEMDSFAESWKVSSKESRRLLTYIFGDAKTSPLKPHEVESTISVNEVRFLIEQLATPIAQVSEIIQDNLLLLRRHKKNLNLENQTVNQLKQQLYIPCVDLQVTELDQPVTVCTDTKCAEVVKVNNVTEWHYKQKCHNPCYLEGIPREMVGDPGLINCAAMNGTENCTECSCDWRVHMHIYKTTEKIQTQKEDASVRDAIKDKEDARVKIEALMKDLNQRTSELEVEGEIISESVARFSFFLQEHALTPFNDAYSDYIKQLIKNEKSLGKFSDPLVIENLQKLLQKHEHLQNTMQQTAQKFSSIGKSNLTPQVIKNSICDLYKLKHMGAKIEELIRKSTLCRNKEMQKNFNCVVSPQVDLSGSDESSIYGGSEYSHKSSRSKHHGSDDDVSYKSPMSEYYSKSTISKHSSESDDEGTIKYALSSRSDKSSRTGVDDKYISSSRSTRSSTSRHHGSDDDASVKYESSSRSVKSSRSRHPGSDDDSVKYESTSRSVRSIRSKQPGSDDESVRSSKSGYSSKSRHTHDLDDAKSVSSRSVKSSISRHPGSDDDSVKYESSSRSVRSTRSKQPGSDNESVRSSKSGNSSKSRHTHDLDDAKSVSSRSVKSSISRHPGSDDDSVKYESSSRSVRSTRSKQPGSDDESVRSSKSGYSSKSRHTHDLDDAKSVSSRSVKSSLSRHPGSDDDSIKYESSSRSVRSTQSKQPGSDDEKSVRSSKSGHSSKTRHTHDLDDASSVRSSRSSCYSTGQKSERSSTTKHTYGSDDEKSVKSSSRSFRPQLPLPGSQDHKGYNKHLDHDSNRKISKNDSPSKSESQHASDGKKLTKEYYFSVKTHVKKEVSESSEKSPMSQFYSNQQKKEKSLKKHDSIESEE